MRVSTLIPRVRLGSSVRGRVLPASAPPSGGASNHADLPPPPPPPLVLATIGVVGGAGNAVQCTFTVPVWAGLVQTLDVPEVPAADLLYITLEAPQEVILNFDAALLSGQHLVVPDGWDGLKSAEGGLIAPGSYLLG